MGGGLGASPSLFARRHDGEGSGPSDRLSRSECRAPRNLDRVRQLRARHRARASRVGHESRRTSASTSSRRAPTPASANKRVSEQTGEEVPNDRIVKGYEIEPGPLRGDRARRARGARAEGEPPDRDRGLRRPRRHRPRLLRAALLPRPRQERGEGLPAPRRGDAGGGQGRDRPVRDALEGGAGRDPRRRRRARARDDALRRRGARARPRPVAPRGRRPSRPSARWRWRASS